MLLKKSYLGMALLAGLLTACMNDDESLYRETDAKAIVSNYVMTEKFEVPIKDGYSTVVKLGDDTLYYGNVAMSINVPKFSMSSTRAIDDLKWYHVIVKPANAGEFYYKVTRYGVLAFEDMLEGDNDYNDFICGLAESLEFNGDEAGWILTATHTRIKPLALGNTLKLGFGVEFRKISDQSVLKDLVISTDVRQDFFGNSSGFINTTSTGTIIPLGSLIEKPFPIGVQIPTTLPDNQLCVLWYISEGGVKRYVADANSNLLTQNILATMITGNKVPFGLFIPGAGISENTWATTFKWPVEKTSIFSGYTSFNNWLTGAVNTPFGSPQTSLLFDTSLMGL